MLWVALAISSRSVVRALLTLVTLCTPRPTSFSIILALGSRNLWLDSTRRHPRNDFAIRFLSQIANFGVVITFLQLVGCKIGTQVCVLNPLVEVSDWLHFRQFESGREAFSWTSHSIPVYLYTILSDMVGLLFVYLELDTQVNM